MRCVCGRQAEWRGHAPCDDTVRPNPTATVFVPAMDLATVIQVALQGLPSRDERSGFWGQGGASSRRRQHAPGTDARCGRPRVDIIESSWMLHVGWA